MSTLFLFPSYILKQIPSGCYGGKGRDGTVATALNPDTCWAWPLGLPWLFSPPGSLWCAYVPGALTASPGVLLTGFFSVTSNCLLGQVLLWDPDIFHNTLLSAYKLQHDSSPLPCPQCFPGGHLLPPPAPRIKQALPYCQQNILKGRFNEYLG